MSEAQLTSIGDELEHLVSSAQDALTDDMVTRLSANLAEGLDLLDRINRSGIGRALPAVAQLVENGDLDRLLGMARLVGAIEDSMSDDIVNRLAGIVTGLAALVDKLTRNEGLLRLIDLLGQDGVSDTLGNLLGAASTAQSEAASLPAAKGGFGGLWQIAADPNTQEALRFMGLLSKHLKQP